MGMILTRRYNVDRFGYLIPHRYGNLPMVGAVATYRPGEGRFGGAVAVEEGTTNLVYGSGTIFRGTHISPDELPAPPPVTPVFCYTWTYLDWAGDIELAKTFQAGDVVTISGWIYESGPWAILDVFGTENGTVRNFGRVFKTTGQIGWHYFEKTVVFQGETTNFHIEDGGWDSYNPDREDESQIWLVNVQMEEKPFATSFVDGTRAAGRLTYPLVGSSEFTVAVWFKGLWIAENKPIPNWMAILQLAEEETSGSRWYLEVDNDGSGNPRFITPGGVLAPYDNEWHHFVVVRRSDGVHQVYFDGEYKQQNTPGWTPSFLRLGHQIDGKRHLNCLFDELLILPYAASEEEIVSWYEAQGPLPPHPQASLQWDRQTVRPAQMVKL